MAWSFFPATVPGGLRRLLLVSCLSRPAGPYCEWSLPRGKRRARPLAARTGAAPGDAGDRRAESERERPDQRRYKALSIAPGAMEKQRNAAVMVYITCESGSRSRPPPGAPALKKPECKGTNMTRFQSFARGQPSPESRFSPRLSSGGYRIPEGIAGLRHGYEPGLLHGLEQQPGRGPGRPGAVPRRLDRAQRAPGGLPRAADGERAVCEAE